MRADRHIKADLHDLSFRSVIPGGFASAQFTLSRPLTLQPDEIVYYGRVYIYDERTGRTVWEGRLEDPGRSAGDQGPLYALAAVGSSAHARDRTVPYIVMDTSLERWKRSSAFSNRSAAAMVDERDDDTPALMIKAPEGTSVTSGWDGDMVYKSLWHCDQELARFRVTALNGGTVNWENRLVTRQNNGGGTIVASGTWNTSDTTYFAAKGDGTNPIPAGHNVAHVRITYTGSPATAGSQNWGEFINVAIKAVLKNADGTDITSGYTVSYTYASSIVNDLLGRFLTKYDGGSGSSVEQTGFQLTQAAWPDGATPADILDDLMEIEPAYYWTAGATNASGKWHFEWRSWPTSVRYEADVIDGLNSQGAAGELFNQVLVRYRTPRGYTHFRRRTQTVPQLTDAGLTREAFLDLGDETGLVGAQADQAGDQFLVEHKTPLNAAQLTISRPILDRDTGMMVQPWEIRPGHLIRVRGIESYRDSLNLTTRDGITVYKIVAVDFNASTASATLDLDTHTPSVARRIAQLRLRRITRRR